MVLRDLKAPPEIVVCKHCQTQLTNKRSAQLYFGKQKKDAKVDIRKAKSITLLFTCDNCDIEYELFLTKLSFEEATVKGSSAEGSTGINNIKWKFGLWALTELTDGED